MSRLPFLFIITGMIGFVLFHTSSLLSLTGWMDGSLRGPEGWFHIHLFVLGWGTMLAMGAVYQLIHVILQSKIYSERLGYAHYLLFTVGLTGLLYGFIRSETVWIAIFATITSLGILLFVWNMFVTLFRAAQWNAITISAACAVFYLLLTAVSGMLMGLNFINSEWAGMIHFHDRLFGSHIWLGTTGWFGLLIVGFSYKMLPMFYLAHNYSTRLQTVTTVVWNIGVLCGTLAFLTGMTWGVWWGLLVITAALITYNIHLWQIKNYRHKKNPGRGIVWSVYASQSLAAIALFMTWYTAVYPESLLHAKFVALTGWIYLGGWVSFTILCYTSKIVPFLWWTHKYGHQAGKPGVPVMADLLDERKVHWGLMTIAILTFTMMVGILLSSSLWIALFGMLFSVSSILYIVLIGCVFAR